MRRSTSGNPMLLACTCMQHTHLSCKQRSPRCGPAQQGRKRTQRCTGQENGGPPTAVLMMRRFDSAGQCQVSGHQTLCALGQRAATRIPNQHPIPSHHTPTLPLRDTHLPVGDKRSAHQGYARTQGERCGRHQSRLPRGGASPKPGGWAGQVAPPEAAPDLPQGWPVAGSNGSGVLSGSTGTAGVHGRATRMRAGRPWLHAQSAGARPAGRPARLHGSRQVVDVDAQLVPSVCPDHVGLGERLCHLPRQAVGQPCQRGALGRRRSLCKTAATACGANAQGRRSRAQACVLPASALGSTPLPGCAA